MPTSNEPPTFAKPLVVAIFFFPAPSASTTRCLDAPRTCNEKATVDGRNPWSEAFEREHWYLDPTAEFAR